MNVHRNVIEVTVSHNGKECEVVKVLAIDGEYGVSYSANDDLKIGLARAVRNQGVLDVLAQDPSSRVREAVASNRFISRKTIERLSEDESIDVVCKIARHRDIPLKLVPVFMHHEDWRVRYALTENLALTLDFLSELCKDDNEYVVVGALTHPNMVDKEIVRKYMTNQCVEIREAATKRLRELQAAKEY